MKATLYLKDDQPELVEVNDEFEFKDSEMVCELYDAYPYTVDHIVWEDGDVFVNENRHD